MAKLPKIISKEEFLQLLEATLKNKFRAKNNKVKALCMILGFEAGLRISEIVGFKSISRKKDKKTGEIIQKDIDIPQLTADKIDFEANTIRLDNAKGRKDRIVPLPKKIKPSHAKMLPVTLTRRSIQHHVETISKKVLNRKISFHTLRAGFATHLMNNGVPVHQVQVLMGHSRGETTLIYARANPKEAIDSARAVF